MNRYVLDSYAWLEYLDGSQQGRKVLEILLDDSAECLTCAVSLAEVVSKLKRRGMDPDYARKTINADSRIIEVDEPLSYAAGIIHSERRRSKPDFGLADAFIVAVAAEAEAIIVTGDPHFHGEKGILFLG